MYNFIRYVVLGHLRNRLRSTVVLLFFIQELILLIMKNVRLSNV